MRDLQRELEGVLESAAATQASAAAAATASPWVPRPPTDALPVQAQWQRTTAAAPSAQSLRNEGFRRGLLVGAFVLACAAAGFTFFVLPGLVTAQRTPPAAAVVPAAPEPAQPPAKPVADFARMAEQKRLAEARREPLPRRLQQLETRDVAGWGGTAHTQRAQ